LITFEITAFIACRVCGFH